VELAQRIIDVAMAQDNPTHDVIAIIEEAVANEDR
jgi:hypothetical protein